MSCHVCDVCGELVDHQAHDVWDEEQRETLWYCPACCPVCAPFTGEPA